MGVKPITVENFRGGLNLSVTSDIADNCFQIAKNVFYNQKGQIQTRYGIQTFGATVGSNKPVTSYFFFQRDDTGATMALCASGTNMYKYNETLGTRASIKSGLTEYETATGKTTHRTRWDYAVYKNKVYLTNGVDAYSEYDGTTYTTTAQPKYRYINMNTDILYGAGEDLNPSTLYYTNPTPTDGKTVNVNQGVIGGDELGRINGMNELQKLIIIMKSGKVYTMNLSDLTNPQVETIDSQNGGYSDRTIASVGNSLVYLTERGVDTLQARTGTTGTDAIETKSLDENVSAITTKIDELQLNANTALYVKRLGNYYISIDTDGDNIPDTTLVYNSGVKARTQYTYPNLYDYGFYIKADGSYHYIITSAISDQVYEIESGFDDLGEPIEYQIKSKNFDFGEPGSFKTYEYIDIIGLKDKSKDIAINIEVDGVNVGGGMITNAMITTALPIETLGVRPIGDDTLTGSGSDADVDLYEYVARVPLYVTGSTINFSLSSKGGTWTLDKARIGVNGQPMDVFNYSCIV